MRRIIIYVIVLAILFFMFFSSSCTVREENEMRSLLQRSFDLSTSSKLGDKDFYQIKTVYLEMDNAGEVAQTDVLQGYYSREAGRIEQGKRTDRFLWKYVKNRSRKGKGEVNEFTILLFTKDFQYSFGEWTAERFPIDLSLVPKTMEGWKFVVKLIDAHTFNVIADFDSYKEKLVHVGDSTRLPGEGVPISINFPPLFTDTYFKNAPVYVTFRGITLYENEPCAILAFRSDDSRVHMVINMNNMKIPIDGVSYYFGEILLSLEARKIVWGEIIERVDSVTNLPQLGPPMKHVTRREITLERMDREEFERLFP